MPVTSTGDFVEIASGPSSGVIGSIFTVIIGSLPIRGRCTGACSQPPAFGIEGR